MRDISGGLHEVGKLFDAALERPASERLALFESFRPQEWIRRVARELLASHEKAGSFQLEPDKKQAVALTAGEDEPTDRSSNR